MDFLKHRAKRPAKVIALGDKLANVRSLARDYKLLGDELWQRFNMKDKNMQGWYYKSMIECFEEFSDYHESTSTAVWLNRCLKTPLILI